MKKIVLLLLTILLGTIISFSQDTLKITNSTVLITSQQLKETNLIFIEHNKLLQENTLLNKQLYNYKEESLTLNKLDSIKTQQLKNYKNLTTSSEDKLEKLNK